MRDKTTILTHLVRGDNVIYTSPTNSGKTIPPVILPQVLKHLLALGYPFPAKPKVLFVTALNSIQTSLVSSMEELGINCCIIRKENAETLLRDAVNSPNLLEKEFNTK